MDMPKKILIDFDGVLTDGKQYIDIDGEKVIYATHSRDNCALAQLIDFGYQVIIITANDSPAIKAYAKRRRCEYLYSRDKDLDSFIAIGDSLFDAKMLNRAQHRFCPADADPTIKSIPNMIVLTRPAGHAVIAELITLIPWLLT